MIIYSFSIICTVCHALRVVSIKALLLHAPHITVVIKYIALPVKRAILTTAPYDQLHMTSLHYQQMSNPYTADKKRYIYINI